jgi:hypothetical protein
MRAAFSLIALAATALAANIPVRGERGLVDRTYGHGGKDTPDKGKPDEDCETITTKVIVTYTTVCPVTETHTKPGHTYTTTFTTTSTVQTVVPTTIVITKTAPPVTKSTDKGRPP